MNALLRCPICLPWQRVLEKPSSTYCKYACGVFSPRHTALTGTSGPSLRTFMNHPGWHTGPSETSVARLHRRGYNRSPSGFRAVHFHSLDYLAFLCVAVCGWWLLARASLVRVAFLLGASWLFYMAWSPAYIGLIVVSTLLDYVTAIGIETARGPRTKRGWLVASVVGNLGLLGAFKYYNFFVSATSDGLARLGIDVDVARLDVLLPVGISFYTFQGLGYTIDVYRGRMPAERSFARYALFMAFFPQLVAGPIVRATELLPQLAAAPRLRSTMVGEGLFLIAVGLVKKLAFADYLAVNFVDRVFDTPGAYSASEVMIALYAYTLQIYGDFSGYTDVARGSGMLFGLRLPENFDRPYQATSPADFWRRWHMTLSTWLRDYLYFPLGGSHVPAVRAYWNLGLTMFLIGLWHGAAWTFVIYGLLQAAAMLIHRFLYRRSGRTRETIDPRWLRWVKIVGTLHFVVLSRIFFRSSDVDNALEVGAQLGDGTFSFGHIPVNVWLVLLVGYAAHYAPRDWMVLASRRFVALPAPAQGAALVVVGAALSTFATGDVVPYIYFQF